MMMKTKTVMISAGTNTMIVITHRGKVTVSTAGGSKEVLVDIKDSHHITHDTCFVSPSVGNGSNVFDLDPKLNSAMHRSSISSTSSGAVSTLVMTKSVPFSSTMELD